MKGGRSSSLPAEEVTCDPPADDSDDEEAEGQRMLKDAPEVGCSLGEELRVAVEKEKGDGEEERAVVAEGFGKVPMEEGVSCALESAPWAAIARGGADDAAREGVGRWIKKSIQPHSYPEEQEPDE